MASIATNTIIFLVAITTILFAHIAPATSFGYVVDDRGEKITDSDYYFIIPALINGKALTYNTSTSPDNCPLYVTQGVTPEEYQTYPGIPIIISNDLLPTPNVPEKSPIYIDFFATRISASCGEFAGRWKVDKDFHVTVAGTSKREPALFQFEKVGYNYNDGVYLINYCDGFNECMTVGLSKKDGITLGVKDVVPLPVRLSTRPFLGRPVNRKVAGSFDHHLVMPSLANN